MTTTITKKKKKKKLFKILTLILASTTAILRPPITMTVAAHRTTITPQLCKMNMTGESITTTYDITLSNAYYW